MQRVRKEEDSRGPERLPRRTDSSRRPRPGPGAARPYGTAGLAEGGEGVQGKLPKTVPNTFRFASLVVHATPPPVAAPILVRVDTGANVTVGVGHGRRPVRTRVSYPVAGYSTHGPPFRRPDGPTPRCGTQTRTPEGLRIEPQRSRVPSGDPHPVLPNPRRLLLPRGPLSKFGSDGVPSQRPTNTKVPDSTTDPEVETDPMA